MPYWHALYIQINWKNYKPQQIVALNVDVGVRL
jgi:hypothetical protein